MKPRSQLIISACAVPAFAFIALNRWATHQLAWAAMWAVLTVMHGLMLIDAIRSTTKTEKGPQ